MTISLHELTSCGINRYARLPLKVRMRGLRWLQALGFHDDVERLMGYEARMTAELQRLHPPQCMNCRKRIAGLLFSS